MTEKEIESMINDLPEAELEELYKRDLRIFQDKEAFMRGDKNHKYSAPAVFLFESWEQEKRMKG